MFILVLLSSPETVHFVGAGVGADRQVRGHAATDPQAQRTGGYHTERTRPGMPTEAGFTYRSPKMVPLFDAVGSSSIVATAG